MDVQIEKWLSQPESGWIPERLPHTVATATFLEDDGGDRIRVRYFRDEADGSLAGKVWFGPAAQGPPGHAHGGSIAALLDEAMGGAGWIAGHPVVAVQITTRFKRMLPLEAAYLLRARIVGQRGRKVHARGELRGRDGSLFADAEGVFVELDMERLGKLAEKAVDLRPYLKIRRQQ